jgi:hypothetical protein
VHGTRFRGRHDLDCNRRHQFASAQISAHGGDTTSSRIARQRATTTACRDPSKINRSCHVQHGSDVAYIVAFPEYDRPNFIGAAARPFCRAIELQHLSRVGTGVAMQELQQGRSEIDAILSRAPNCVPSVGPSGARVSMKSVPSGCDVHRGHLHRTLTWPRSADADSSPISLALSD